MTLVAPFGFYGWGNIGDEATLQGFAALVRSRRPVPSVWVGSRNLAHTRRVEPSFNYFRADRNSLRRRWAQFRAAAAVFPGGTPIMDGLGEWPLNEVGPLVAAAREAGRKVAFVGVGTERLHRPESARLVGCDLGPHVEHWTVRSERDHERLIGWGVPRDRVTVAADLAWLLTPASNDFGRSQLAHLGITPADRIVGINVNNESVMLEEQPRLFEILAAVADTLIEEQGVRILFFCSEVREGNSFDKAAAQRVVGAMRRPRQATMLPNHYWAPRQLASVLACCELILSTRYHVCLLSALQTVPFVAIQRSDKVRNLCSDIRWPYGIDLRDLQTGSLLDYTADIRLKERDLRIHLEQATERQAQMSAMNELALAKLNART
jgi:polysaccharide pyruvyl transferase WcaK-like protein